MKELEDLSIIDSQSWNESSYHVHSERQVDLRG
jgi:hypothetical protein